MCQYCGGRMPTRREAIHQCIDGGVAMRAAVAARARIVIQTLPGRIVSVSTTFLEELETALDADERFCTKDQTGGIAHSGPLGQVSLVLLTPLGKQLTFVAKDAQP